MCAWLCANGGRLCVGLEEHVWGKDKAGGCCGVGVGGVLSSRPAPLTPLRGSAAPLPHDLVIKPSSLGGSDHFNFFLKALS